MKQITVTFRNEEDATDEKITDLLEKIGLIAADLGLVVDAESEDVYNEDPYVPDTDDEDLDDDAGWPDDDLFGV